jgi:hypothetical protein
MDKKILNNIITKLSEEKKVELGAIDNFKSQEKIFDKRGQDFTSHIEKIINERDSGRKRWVDYVNAFSKLDKEYQEIRKATMDLGIDVPKNIENAYKVSTTFMKQSKKEYQKYLR